MKPLETMNEAWSVCQVLQCLQPQAVMEHLGQRARALARRADIGGAQVPRGSRITAGHIFLASVCAEAR